MAEAAFVFGFWGVRLVRILRLVVGLLGVASLAGCADAPKPVVQAPRVMPPHVGPPLAGVCHVAPFTVADGGSASVAISMVNDGGYCAARLTNAAGQPFDAPLLPAQARHGQAAVWKYDGKTSVEYVPAAGFAGTDSFVVHLKMAGKPGYTTLRVSVTVS